jgi:hypothetical protein
MPNVYGADPALTSQQLTLLTSSRALVRAQVIDVTSSAFDHVVRSLSDLPAPSGGLITLTSGSWAFAAPINLGTDIILVPIGEVVYLKGLGWDKVLTGVTAIRVQGTAILDTMSIAATSVGVQTDAATSRLYIDQSQIAGTSTNDICVRVTAADRVQITGGRLTGAGFANTRGVSVSGNISGGLQLSNIEADGLTTFLYLTAPVQSIVVCNCNTTTITNGISMNVADTPVQGMSVVASSFNTPTPFTSFTAASPRINIKACLGSAGLLSETAIVP